MSIGFKASAETDQDIIAWWEALPTGDRSRALRAIIRAAINQQANHPNGNSNSNNPIMEQVATDTAWLRAALIELPTYLEGLFTRMPVAQAEVQSANAGVQPEEQLRLNQAALERRRANMKRSTW